MPTEADPTSVAAPRRLADGVHLVELPLPIEGLSTVNSYVLETARGLVLVDPGWATPASEAALAGALAALGYGLADARWVVATHAHWDHYTQAVALRDRHGAELLLGWGERHSVAAFEDQVSYFPRQEALLRQAGAEGLADRVAAFPYRRPTVPFGPPDRWLRDGEALDLGGRLLVAHATPGHTRGHVVFADEAAGLLYTGDHVLPRITPSTGFEREPEDDPLGSFLGSLRRVLQLPDAVLAPAHGPVSPSVHARASALLEHHRGRWAQMRDAAAGGASPYEVARALPWTRERRRLEDLGLMHQVLAVLEVAAHLGLGDELLE